MTNSPWSASFSGWVIPKALNRLMSWTQSDVPTQTRCFKISPLVEQAESGRRLENLWLWDVLLIGGRQPDWWSLEAPSHHDHHLLGSPHPRPSTKNTRTSVSKQGWEELPSPEGPAESLQVQLLNSLAHFFKSSVLTVSTLRLKQNKIYPIMRNSNFRN